MPRYITTERIGVNAVEGIVLKELHWIFREQPIEDKGIDAHIELVDEGTPTGKLLALQIKSGAGNFTETDNSFVYYGKLVHLEYWLNHSLPVLLIAHFPDTNQTFWVLVNKDTAEKTPKHWKIEVPKSNVLGQQSIAELTYAFDGSPAQQKLRKLSIDEPLMRHLEQGGKVSVGLEDWVNKSLGRTPVEVFVSDDDGNEILSRKWFVTYTNFSIEGLAQKLFPWAKIVIDEEFYDENCEEESFETSLERAIDEDNGVFSSNPPPDSIYPYDNFSGEVEAYRLELKLNEFSQAYLLVSDYLNED